ncbi:MAG: ABC transporter transmembrane domain-containing protein, partial [Oscillospiraceae bacterium]
MAEIKKGPGMHGPAGRMMAGEKAKDFKGTMRKLFAYLGKYIWAIIAVALLAAAATVFSIVGPKILGTAIDKLFEGIMATITGTGSIDFTAVGQILLFLLGIYLVSAALSAIQGFVMTNISTKVSYNMRRDLDTKINRMPLAYFDVVQSGDVLSRITNDVD